MHYKFSEGKLYHHCGVLLRLLLETIDKPLKIDEHVYILRT